MHPPFYAWYGIVGPICISTAKIMACNNLTPTENQGTETWVFSLPYSLTNVFTFIYALSMTILSLFPARDIAFADLIKP